MKICFKCQQEKQSNEFYKNSARKDGLQTICKTCTRSYDRYLDYPLSRGFSLTTKNAVVLCRLCNSSKCNKLPKDFYSKKQLEALEALHVSTS